MIDRRTSVRRARRIAVALAALAAAIPCTPASADRAFTVRFQTNAQGDVTGTGNSLMTCRTSDPGCPDARNGVGSGLNNNNRFMTRVDLDDDPATFTSSSAALRLPAGATATASSTRTQPCERAVPSGSARLAPPRPWIATWPGPPPKRSSTSE